MRDALLLCVTFASAAGVIELFVARKLQSALGTIVAIHLLGLVAVVVPPMRVRPVAAVVFWIGAATLWFGARSHLESSILLWIVRFLRRRPATRDEVLAAYDRHYGHQARIAELARAGFIADTPNGWAATRKGRVASRIAELLR